MVWLCDSISADTQKGFAGSAKDLKPRSKLYFDSILCKQMQRLMRSFIHNEESFLLVYGKLFTSLAFVYGSMFTG